MESVLCLSEGLAYIGTDRTGQRRSHFRHRVVHTYDRRVALVVPGTPLLDAGTVEAVFRRSKCQGCAPSTVACLIVTLVAALENGHV